MIATLPPPVLTLLVDPPAVAITREVGSRSVLIKTDRSPRAETMRVLIEQGKAQGLSTDFIVDSCDRRITRYLATVGHRSAGDRNATAYRVARWLVNDFGASESVAWSYLHDWNAGNTPPLGERELTCTMRSAQRHGSRPAGCAHAPRGSA